MSRTLDLQPRKAPMQERSRATYAAILEAGARVLQRDGYAALTTNSVAKTAGIAIASLYEYFPNKQAVVAAVTTETVNDVMADIERALEQAVSEGGELGLATWIGAMFDALQTRRTITAVLIREVPFLREVPAVRAVRTRLLKLAARGQVMGAPSIPSAHVKSALYLLPIMVSSAVLEAVTSPPRELQREEIEGGLVDMLTRVIFTSTATETDAKHAHVAFAVPAP